MASNIMDGSWQWEDSAGTSGVSISDGKLLWWHRPGGPNGHLGEVAREQELADFIRHGAAVSAPDEILSQIKESLGSQPALPSAPPPPEPTLLEQAVRFMQDYIEAEWAAYCAKLSERDLLTRVRPQRRARRFMSPELTLLDILPDSPYSAEDWEKAPGILARYRQRHLFAAARSEHSSCGPLFTFFTSGTSAAGEATATTRLHAALTDGEFRLVAWDHWCAVCKATGRQGSVTCSECRGGGWSAYRGSAPTGRIKPVEFLIVAEPTDDLSASIIGAARDATHLRG